MANTNAPFGFRQVGGTGSAPTYEQVPVVIAYNASAIYFGDVVTPQADGTVAIGAGTDTEIAGVFVGCKYLSVSQKRIVWSHYWPGSDVASSDTVEGYIINDPNATFLVQTDGTGYDQTAVNANCTFAVGTPSAVTGNSGMYVTAASLNTTDTLPFRVVSLYNAPPGAPGTFSNGQPYDWVYVRFNSVATKSLTGV
jgi:hypothetical protein